jgi:tetratricopeptide (TPR) repeat protein
MLKNAKIIVRVAGVLIVLMVLGCGGAKLGGGGDGKTGGVDAEGKPIITKEARKDFDRAVEAYKEAEKEGWNEKNCESVAKKFRAVAKGHNNMAEAMYNVGCVYTACNMTDKAKAAFKKTLQKHAKHQPSMIHLAIIDLEAGKGEAGQAKLKEAILAGRNTLEAVPAYNLAATILRAKAKSGDGEAWKKAQNNLRTALAIDSKYMPALYQLTMLYYDIAVELNKPSYLTLASLVYNQAVKLDPEYAPNYHALGLINLQKNELVEALKAFEAAFQKDPTLYEAYMSFGAINLNFRGYAESKNAFEKAIGLKPSSYDAHMGLGVAARGLGDFTLAKAEYKKAAEIDPARTDYIFNLGLLEMDYTNDGTPEGYEKASKVFEKFLKKATADHKVDPDGKRGKRLSWYSKAEKRITSCKKASKQIREALKEMAELEKMAVEQAKIAKEAEEMQKKAEELAKEEAAGKIAKGDEVDEAAIEAELAAEEKAAEDAAKAEKEAKKADEEAEKAEAEAEKNKKADEDKKKGSVNLEE